MYSTLSQMVGARLFALLDNGKAQARNYIHRLIVAGALVGLGIASIISALGYLASSLWRALEPAVGAVGSDIILAGVYTAVAGGVMAYGFKLVRSP